MNAFKTQLLNTAAHELNTPITPLRLQIHMLREGTLGELNERQRHAIAVLDRNIVRLSNLVKEILDVSRLESGSLRVEPEPLDVDGLVADVLASFQEAARQVGVEIRVTGESRLTMLADADRITQVLYNLLSNAIKFSPEGGRVVVDVQPKDGRVELTVRDEGPGLSREQRDRLFQPFSQVHDELKFAVGGTGLGLYISKGLVEAHGGIIGCESPGPGKGSSFFFALPIAVPAVMRAPSSPPSQPRMDPLLQRIRELI